MRPSPINNHYLATLNDPLASAELAKFNIEFNCLPEPLTGHVLMACISNYSLPGQSLSTR